MRSKRCGGFQEALWVSAATIMLGKWGTHFGPVAVAFHVGRDKGHSWLRVVDVCYCDRVVLPPPASWCVQKHVLSRKRLGTLQAKLFPLF